MAAQEFVELLARVRIPLATQKKTRVSVFLVSNGIRKGGGRGG